MYKKGFLATKGDNGIEGYLVSFTSETDTDLTGDFFTKDTNFGEALKIPIFFDHGMDYWIDREQIGYGELERKSDGIYVAKTVLEIKNPERFKQDQLRKRQEYLDMIEELAYEKSLGWSSGAVGHLVVREKKFGGTYWIKQWIIGEGSLTPTPAEPGNMATIKSIYENHGLEYKVGAKISKSRVEKLKKAHEILKEILEDVEIVDDEKFINLENENKNLKLEIMKMNLSNNFKL